jgi:plastocyanin
MRRLLAFSVVLFLPLSACGDDDSGGSAGDGEGANGNGAAIEVVARDIDFGEASYEAPAGEVTFAYENEGTLVHTLLIDGVEGFKLEVSSRGARDEGAVTLEAGDYTLYCDVPGHRDTGMEARLTVE